ncbi:MAG TPA: UDP-N-acetylmuramate:L-alanyl-gamma-D-glutamyl-meso-diaminopimelate ligase [Burkholderiaceae bacterium]|nr:UDP-N-acetylmuramate:L-alanyl-gamma-D-glutamyl-meso-diaminopimelate ligase [Burkholderiaceae bacterium]
MHLHILGVGGTFMGGLAQLAQAAGHVVTGCDASVYPPMSDQLVAANVRVLDGYDADQLSLNPDVWVIGNVVTRGNALMEAILDRGDAYVSGPQWLAENILRGRHVLAVAGTHGKTTTSAMLAKILEHAGLEPGFLIGGVPDDFARSARLGGGRHFVIEADEYDTAFFDKRSKFLHYRARTLILNNLEFDHADIFSDLAAIEAQFHHLIRTLPAVARIVANAGDEALGRVLQRGCWSELQTFGEMGDWRIDDRTLDMYRGTHCLGSLQLALAGKHNQMNAVAAVAAADHAGVAGADALAALAEFRGVKRRLELRGTAAGVTVIDDFAHHPTAFAMTIAALRAQHPQSRIVAVFEPRSNTMKRGAMNARLADSLSDADRVFCFSEGLGWNAAHALAGLGEKATVHHELDALIKAVVTYARAGDQVVVMSNGGFGGVQGKLLAQLADSASSVQGRGTSAGSVESSRSAA